jgi:two-component system, NarL family, nitrate/nitrite response regulator NarL
VITIGETQCPSSRQTDAIRTAVAQSRPPQCPVPPPRAYIVSEVRLYREGLITSLSRQQGLLVVGAGTRSDALDQIGRLKPDVMLLDVASRENLALPRQARRLVPELRVIAFAVAEVEADVLACAEAGFCGYDAQDGSVEDLVGAVRCAISGELVCSPRIASLLFNRLGHLSTPGTATAAGGRLTPREREIAALVARGLSNKEVARQLGISGATIKNHVHNILQKLDIRRRGELATLRLGTALYQSALSGYGVVRVLSDAL